MKILIEKTTLEQVLEALKDAYEIDPYMERAIAKCKEALTQTLPVQPVQEPTCPKCKNNRQVWTNQITGLKTCHRVGCTWEQPAQEPLTDEQANKLLWIGAVPTTNGAIYREPLSYRKELMAHRLQGLRLGEAAHNIGARP